MLNEIRKRFIVALTVMTSLFLLNQTEAKAWWYCMYPQETLKSAVRASVDQDGNRKEKEEMTEEDYQEMNITSRYQVKFFLLGDGYDKLFGKTLH